MTSECPAIVASDESPLEPEGSEQLAAAIAHDLGAVARALASVLRETIVRFESSVGRITDIVQPARASRELIVAFQEFDRLQQEFSALSNVLDYFAENASGTVYNFRDAIDSITIANVKGRLVRYLQEPAQDLSPEESEEVVF
jgi:hypothetical protein